LNAIFPYLTIPKLQNGQIPCPCLSSCQKNLAESKIHAKKNQQRICAKRNIENLTKVTKTIPLLIKTLPFLIKTIPKPYYFLTLFVRIFHFLRFCAVAKSRSFSALMQVHFRTNSAHLRKLFLSALTFT